MRLVDMAYWGDDMNLIEEANKLSENIRNGASESDVIQALNDLLIKDREKCAELIYDAAEDWGDVAEESGMKTAASIILTRDIATK